MLAPSSGKRFRLTVCLRGSVRHKFVLYPPIKFRTSMSLSAFDYRTSIWLGELSSHDPRLSPCTSSKSNRPLCFSFSFSRLVQVQWTRSYGLPMTVKSMRTYIHHTSYHHDRPTRLPDCHALLFNELETTMQGCDKSKKTGMAVTNCSSFRHT